MQCGKENDDQAVFCVGCGQRFPDQAATATQPTGETPQTPSSSSLYTAEMGAGAHKHILTDVYLKDSSGKVLLVARKQSLLHSEYTIVDGNEVVTGFIRPQTHLTHRTSSVEDANHSALGSIQVSNVSQNRAPPSCWLEDAGGNRLGTMVFTTGLFSFAGVRVDGSPIFEASVRPASGVREALTERGHRAYDINLLDPGLPLPMLVAVIAALGQG